MGEKKTMLARRNPAVLVTHIGNNAFDEGCALQINGSRKRFVKLCVSLSCRRASSLWWSRC